MGVGVCELAAEERAERQRRAADVAGAPTGTTGASGPAGAKSARARVRSRAATAGDVSDEASGGGGRCSCSLYGVTQASRDTS